MVVEPGQTDHVERRTRHPVCDIDDSAGTGTARIVTGILVLVNIRSLFDDSDVAFIALCDDRRPAVLEFLRFLEENRCEGPDGRRRKCRSNQFSLTETRVLINPLQ